MSLVSPGDPSAEFLEAAELWNAQTTTRRVSDAHVLDDFRMIILGPDLELVDGGASFVHSVPSANVEDGVMVADTPITLVNGGWRRSAGAR